MDSSDRTGVLEPLARPVAPYGLLTNDGIESWNRPSERDRRIASTAMRRFRHSPDMSGTRSLMALPHAIIGTLHGLRAGTRYVTIDHG